MQSLRSTLNYLRPHKTIPQTKWTAKHRWDLSPSRVGILTFGLLIFGLGEACLIQSHTGNSPWAVLSQGVSKHTHLDLGVSTFLISGVILLLWWPLGERPGFGTIANMFVIAFGIQLGADIFPVAHSLPVGLIYDLIGIGAVGIGSGLYITCGLGPGPRDGLMTSLHRKTGIRVSRIRLCIEGAALVTGWLLGGRLGIGTALFALLIGHSVAIALGLVAKITHQTI